MVQGSFVAQGASTYALYALITGPLTTLPTLGQRTRVWTVSLGTEEAVRDKNRHSKWYVFASYTLRSPWVQVPLAYDPLLRQLVRRFNRFACVFNHPTSCRSRRLDCTSSPLNTKLSVDARACTLSRSAYTTRADKGKTAPTLIDLLDPQQVRRGPQVFALSDLRHSECLRTRINPPRLCSNSRLAPPMYQLIATDLTLRLPSWIWHLHRASRRRRDTPHHTHGPRLARAQAAGIGDLQRE